jgi:hypothetical protein
MPWADRQLPQGGEVFLDHVGFFVDDLRSAGQRLERLGFQVSPINLQQNADEKGALRPSGTSNRVARLRRGFIELLAATHETPLADQLRCALARYQGLHLIALSHADIPAQRTHLIAAGFAMQATVRLRRHVQAADGLREIAWSVLRPQPGVMPEGRVQFALCHTPALVWPDDAPALANAAEGLTDILLCVEDRREAADRYGRYAGRRPADNAGLDVVALDRGRMVFVGSTQAPAILPVFQPAAVPLMAGQALRSSDLAATRAVLQRNGVVPVFVDEDLVCVGPADALGAYLLFHAAGVHEPWAALRARR